MANAEENKSTAQIKLPVYGMTCEHCVWRVTKALEKLPGVVDVRVSLTGSSNISSILASSAGKDLKDSGRTVSQRLI